MQNFYVIIRKRRFLPDQFLVSFNSNFNFHFGDYLDYAETFFSYSAALSALHFCQENCKGEYCMMLVAFLPLITASGSDND